MIETDTPPLPGPKMRVLGWLGLWLSAVLLFPLLTVWVQSFDPRRCAHLPTPGSLLFWQFLGGDVLLASLMTFSAWKDQNKPVRRPKSAARTTPKDHLRRGLAGAGLLAFFILRGLAASPGASVNWLGLLSGAALIAADFALLLWCIRLAMPPPLVEEDLRTRLSCR
ncbi:MAG: hypothetical protein M3Y13_15900 [Armatimonadota bacterium]|nr:hypothetical protein [Armatimonadota bacterium]